MAEAEAGGSTDEATDGESSRYPSVTEHFGVAILGFDVLPSFRILT